MLSRSWCTDRELGLPSTGEEEFLKGLLSVGDLPAIVAFCSLSLR